MRTLWGNETTKLERSWRRKRSSTRSRRCYPAKTTQLTSEIQTLKAANPNVVMQSSYLGGRNHGDETYKELGFSPDMILANDAGFTDTEFIAALARMPNTSSRAKSGRWTWRRTSR